MIEVTQIQVDGSGTKKNIASSRDVCVCTSTPTMPCEPPQPFTASHWLHLSPNAIISCWSLLAAHKTTYLCNYSKCQRIILKWKHIISFLCLRQQLSSHNMAARDEGAINNHSQRWSPEEKNSQVLKRKKTKQTIMAWRSFVMGEKAVFSSHQICLKFYTFILK